MTKMLKLEIITPEAAIYTEDVELVMLPTMDGQIGILPGHMRLMTQMTPGEMIVRENGVTKFLAVGEGLVESTEDRVSILTDLAVPVESIDAARAEEARQRAEAHLREKLSIEEIASVNAALTRSLTQIRVKRRRRV
jgi:F-type H+-transporting ATPase subunit epsilon